MLVRQAKAVAQQWVIEEASTIPGFQGAYIAGSANWLPDDAVLRATSDLDINVVFSTPNTSYKGGGSSRGHHGSQLRYRRIV